ncbi:hypothetical protein [Streptomyces cyaneofuscatus]|uniref:hypothetical protein n=1 Tax=Streptomyces cyaneofuscatus TaxID=66883 RepID=UPI0013DCFDF7|nr:hypothetical protein [Streptomyces cyaneofuscatus]NDZ69062.1 hypothetical protein [Streptomyces cyaneofuscatus]
MAEENGVAGNDTATPAGPFLREYAPTGPFRHSSTRTTSVLFYRNGGHSVAGVSGVRHYDKRALARPHTICEIATGTFVTTLQMELPAAGGATFFKAEVDIHWTVEDPHLVAVQVVTDIAQRLTAPTKERLWEISSQFPVNQAEQANTAITQQCVSGRWSDLGTDLGLRVRLYVRLRVDDRTIGHVDVIRDYQAATHLTDLRQQRFRTMLMGGELDQLSYMLAAEPESAKEFLEKIRQEGRQEEKERVDRLFAMVASGDIASSQLELQTLAYLNRERRSVQGPIGPGPARRAPQQLERGREEPLTPDWVTDAPDTRPARRPVRDADGWDVDGRDSDVRGADRRGADGRDSDVRGADRRGADRRNSGARDADVRDADAWDSGPRNTDVRHTAPDTPAPRGRDDGWDWAEDE